MARDQRRYREIDKQRRHAERRQPETHERCISCGRTIKPGDQWCPGRDADGYECATDLRDSNNRIVDYR